VCIGDFNEVLSSDEHLGVSARGEAQMQQFRDCLEDCQMVDLGFFHPKYTWNNRQQGQHNIRVRMDMVVVNGLFTQMFENAQVENIITAASDHFAVLLSLEKVATKREAFKYNFKYEAAWCRAVDYNDVVGKLWVEGMKE
jgi:endonuclease/exonuclease/phosphatase family metal-dependent hydrolase